LQIDPAVAIEDPISIDDVRFASEIGTPASSSGKSSGALAPQPLVDFRGTSGRSCSSLDLNTFLRQFDPHELLAELRQSLLSGAQSAVSNYLVALAYSAPTLASVLEMSDRQLTTRFTTFAQICGNQQLRAVGLQDSERRMAQASDQCFAREIVRDTAPTDAYRRCSVDRNFDALALPATMSTIDFLRQHTDLAVTQRIESLLGLLPDERIAAGNYQIRPPKVSLSSLLDSLQIRSRLALDQIIDSVTPSAVAECAPDSIFDPLGPACLPRSASALVASPAFRGVRLLGPAARSTFKDALSSQIAITSVYADLLELAQQIARMNLRSDSDASSSEIQSRQRALEEQVVRLLDQANLQVKLEESKRRLARTQLAALERTEADLRAAADALQAQQTVPLFSVSGLLRLFQDRN